jgi:hypothetical protein
LSPAKLVDYKKLLFQEQQVDGCRVTAGAFLKASNSQIPIPLSLFPLHNPEQECCPELQHPLKPYTHTELVP